MHNELPVGVTLIGLPGSGKSTIGVLLAKALVLPFVDTDIQLQSRLNMSLQNYIEKHGYMALRAMEESYILALMPKGVVISTGGSAVYSQPAMRHLSSHSDIVFLDISLPTMTSRLGDFSTRGIAADLSGGLGQLYAERLPLYQQAAQHRIDAHQSVEQVVASIQALVK